MKYAYASRTGNVEEIVNSLGIDALRIDDGSENMDEPYILFTYTDGFGDVPYEVDEFYGENQGLTVAEVELSSEEEDFAKPDWLGEEVTGDVKYYNSMLMKNPFTKW